MRFFDRKNEDEITARLVKNSRVDFDFDRAGGRRRLLAEIEEHQMNLAERRIRQWTGGTFMARHRWATAATAVVLVAVGGGAALAQGNLSMPGDTLHGVDQLQEQLMLKLPWPETQKARIQADIVDERNQELEYAIEANVRPEVTAQAVDDSMQSLDRAIGRAQAGRDDYRSRGRHDQAEKMRNILVRLEALAEAQEKKVDRLRDRQGDEQSKKMYEERLKEIQGYRAKARAENDQNGWQ